MPTYTRYAARTGEILDVIELPPRQRDFDLHNTLLFAGTADGNTHYMVDGAPTARPAMAITSDKSVIAADGVETATITGVMNPSLVTISGPVTMDPVEVADNTLIFSADVPGEYHILFESFPYLPHEIVIDAN